MKRVFLSDYEEWYPVCDPFEAEKEWEVEISDELWERWLRLKAEFKTVQKELRDLGRSAGVQVARDREDS